MADGEFLTADTQQQQDGGARARGAMASSSTTTSGGGTGSFAVDREHDDGSSHNAKLAMLATGTLGQAVAVWICLAGASTVGRWVGGTWDVQHPLRASLMAVSIVALCIKDWHRMLFLLKRKTSYSEAVGLAATMNVVYICYALLSTGLDGTDRWGGWWPALEVNPGDYIGFALFVVGWALSTGSELQRMRWKQNPANAGRCNTDGLWAYSMHINYFGCPPTLSPPWTHALHPPVYHTQPIQFTGDKPRTYARTHPHARLGTHAHSHTILKTVLSPSWSQLYSKD